MNAKEIKLNDVMCGDWIDVRNNVNPSTPHIEKITPSHLLRDAHWYGIELTPEILEKNGFKRDMFYGEWEYNLDPFPFSVVQRKNNSWYLGREEIGIAHNREIIDISYVHELQHALKLCGIDKTIEL